MERGVTASPIASLSKKEAGVIEKIAIREFKTDDAVPVRELFIAVNRTLSPPTMREAFEAYITRSLSEEIDRIGEYYGRCGGSFWVAARDGVIVGMFGLEPTDNRSFELRRMYVDPSVRRCGIGRMMLQFAEEESRRLRKAKMTLSTSELQKAAIELYKKAGYRLTHEMTATEESNKTIGRGIRRFYFEKEF
jgi:GNAT superfamily N-acetyltransferase